MLRQRRALYAREIIEDGFCVNQNVLYSHNIVTLKNIRYSIKKIIIAILTTLFTGGRRGGGPLFLKTGGPIKNQSCMPENYLQNKEFTWVSRFFLFRPSYKIFKKKVFGVQRAPLSPSKRRVNIDI